MRPSATGQLRGPPLRAPTNGRPGSPFGFLGAGTPHVADCFFFNNFFKTHFPRSEFGSSLRMPDANPPPTGFGDPISRSDAPPHPGPLPLGRWGGEPAGHLGADSPSRRAAEHASAKRTKPPCPHWLQGLSQTHHVNAVSRHRRVPPFASSRRPLTNALAHLQWQEPPRFRDASATSRASIKEPSPSRVRPPDRYGRVRTIRDSPSGVAACHRVVRRHTCCSPATRRSIRCERHKHAPRLE